MAGSEMCLSGRQGLLRVMKRSDVAVSVTTLTQMPLSLEL